jgi:hypothetical protein
MTWSPRRTSQDYQQVHPSGRVNRAYTRDDEDTLVDLFGAFLTDKVDLALGRIPNRLEQVVHKVPRVSSIDVNFQTFFESFSMSFRFDFVRSRARLFFRS